mmetsp:Transcript_20387/g.52972  ORF Transcript_20387/g.52972 Transcript_20387/m.52972 type:complete len:701 (-) Transcript_20387:1072-3174(-)
MSTGAAPERWDVYTTVLRRTATWRAAACATVVVAMLGIPTLLSTAGLVHAWLGARVRHGGHAGGAAAVSAQLVPVVDGWGSRPTVPPPAHPDGDTRGNGGESGIQKELVRRRCLQQAMERELRWPLSPRLVWRKGCNASIITDFDGWASRTGCGRAPTSDEKLTLHMAWAGRWNDAFAGDIAATLDSFVVTQDLSRTQLIFWFLEPFPTASASFTALTDRFSGTDTLGRGAVEFRRADLDALARGTCVEHTPRLWRTFGSIPLQTKSDVFRMVVLHQHGGIWIDTDTILLRDVAPIWEWGGEFGGKFAMTLKYNNAFLGLRQNSTLSRELLGLICRFPKIDGRRAEYCAEVGEPCHSEWWYNHGPQQWAVRNKLGLVVFPIALFDPANDCYGRGLLSGSGAYRMKRDWPLSSMLELFRGAYALHTRSYQVAKKDRPLRNDTQFATLFRRLHVLADEAKRFPQVVAPAGIRDAAEQVTFEGLAERNRYYTPPDPTYTPEGPPKLAFVTQKVSGVGALALSVSTLMSNGYAKTFRLVNRTVVVDSPATRSATAAWLIFPRGGFLMPATSIVVQSYCVDAKPIRPIRGRPPLVPDLNHCDPRRSGQRWISRPGSVGTVRFELGGNSTKCFGIAPVEDSRFCGFGGEAVREWRGRELPARQCLNGATVDCADPTATWDVVVATDHFAATARILASDPLPPLNYH